MWFSTDPYPIRRTHGSHPPRRTFRRFQRLALAALTLGALIGAGRCAAGGARPPAVRRRRRYDNEDDDERDIPFGSDRLFVPRWRLTDGPQVRRVPHRDRPGAARDGRDLLRRQAPRSRRRRGARRLDSHQGHAAVRHGEVRAGRRPQTSRRHRGHQPPVRPRAPQGRRHRAARA